MFENRHFDFKRKSWYIGEGQEGKNLIQNSIKAFYAHF